MESTRRLVSMVDENVYTIECLNKEIKAIVSFTDSGINALVAGGDKSHIGVVSIMDESGGLSTTIFPSHKEAVIAEKWAKAFYDKFKKAVVISAGIHYDDISKEEISLVLEAADKLLMCALK